MFLIRISFFVVLVANFRADQLNLWQLARRSQQNTFYRNSYTGIGRGSSGGTSYVIGKDFSVIVDH